MTAALLDQWAIFDQTIPNSRGDLIPLWEPHPAQVMLHEDHHRHQVIVAGRRLGKSAYGGNRLIPEAFIAYSMREDLLSMGKRREFWIVGPTYSEGEKEFRVLWNQLQRLGVPFDTPGSYNLPMSGQMHISLWGGAFQVHVKSAVDPDRLVGESLTGVVMAEAAKMKPIIWTKYIRPMLMDTHGWSVHSTTPEGRNHLYDLYKRGQTSDPEWMSWRMPSWFNTSIFGPTKTKDVERMLTLIEQNAGVDIYDIFNTYKFTIDSEIVQSMGDQPAEKFRQEIGADFTQYVGKTFKDFDPNYHCGTLDFNPGWETFGCADYGFRNPNVFLLGQIGPNGEINFLDEVYTEGQTPLEFAKEIRRRGMNPAALKVFYPDPARPDATAVLEEELMIKGQGGTGGELKVRLDLIRIALKKGVTDSYGVYRNSKEPGRDWRPQMMFDWKCVRSINDFEVYKYAERKDEHQETSTERFENPLKLNDHAPEAVGRFMAGRFGERSQAGQRGESRVSSMTMGRNRRSQNVGSQQPAGKPERYMRITDHEPVGYEYKRDSDPMEDAVERAYYE